MGRWRCTKLGGLQCNICITFTTAKPWERQVAAGAQQLLSWDITLQWSLNKQNWRLWEVLVIAYLTFSSSIKWCNGMQLALKSHMPLWHLHSNCTRQSLAWVTDLDQGRSCQLDGTQVVNEKTGVILSCDDMQQVLVDRQCRQDFPYQLALYHQKVA